MTAPEIKKDAISIEEVGWLFVKNYYGTYTSEIRNLYAFYDKNASLLHDEFPANAESEEPVAKKVHRAAGTDSIKKHFTEQSTITEKNKIVIERADFQSTVENSILIVVCGSWKRGASNLWQFVQTFVLKPAGAKTFDVSNDMLKFIDLSENFEEPQLVEQKADTPAPNGKADEKLDEDKKVTVELEEETVEAVKEEPEAKEKVDETVVENKTPKAKEEVESKPAAEVMEDKEPSDVNGAASKTSSKDTPATAPAAPAPKPTWASLAAMQPKVPVSKTATVPSPGAAKNVPAPSPVVKKATSPAQNVPANQQPNQSQHNSKFKKDEWYPIYIRDADCDEADLRAALTKTFGEMKFFKKNQRVVLCDFKEKEYQQKALEAKEIVVNNVVVHLEPRTHKHNNNNNNNNNKNFKDKKAMKKK